MSERITRSSRVFVAGHRGLWGFVRGGMGGVTQALAAAARSQGAVIRVGAPVERILVADGAARGVVLEGGEEILGRPSGYSGPFAGGTVSFSSATVAGAGGVGLQDNLLDLTRLPRASGDLSGRPEVISDRARQQALRVTRAGLTGRPVLIIRGPGSHLVTPIVR